MINSDSVKLIAYDSINKFYKHPDKIFELCDIYATKKPLIIGFFNRFNF